MFWQPSFKRSMSNNTILKGLERMGYKSRMTGQGFRRLASTLLNIRESPYGYPVRQWGVG
jgi:hypothetical protein